VKTNSECGITATREGLRPKQLGSLETVLLRVRPRVFNHGSCQGGDVQAAQLVRRLFPSCWIVARPGHSALDGLSPFRADSGVDDMVMESKLYSVRNRDIWTPPQVMIGCPATMRQSGGGTWTVIRDCRRAGKLLFVVYPDGQVSDEAPGVAPYDPTRLL
jgi:hypothetical protein